MRPVMILRPQPGNAASCTAARAMSLNALSVPIFEVTPLPWSLPRDRPDALLITSANAIRHAGEQLPALRDIPVWAVGEKSAQAARAAGFAVARVGDAGVAELLAGAPAARLLHLCGRQRTITASAAHQIESIPVYASQAIAPPPAFSDWISDRPVVLIHSPRAAMHFAALIDSTRMPREGIVLVAISAAAARAAGTGWEMVAIAGQTSDEAMLEQARLCAADTIRVET